MLRCNSTGQGRSRILLRGRAIGVTLERRNGAWVEMFEWLCHGADGNCGRCVTALSWLSVCMGHIQPELEGLLREVTEIRLWDMLNGILSLC